jgi:hypothetical protein
MLVFQNHGKMMATVIVGDLQSTVFSGYIRLIRKNISYFIHIKIRGRGIIQAK